VKILAMLFTFAGVSLATATPASNTSTAAPVAKRTPVVVELFTSEGCSDCPPADALLKQLELQQPIPRVQVIAIEEHVDYWNHDGWIDPFSSPDWTLRQQDYVAKLRAGTEYTPQMVVDGESQLVGSFAAAAERTIEIAAISPRVAVAITPGKADGDDAQEFSVSVGSLSGAKASGDADVWLAVTEDGLHSSVSAGENAGHELYHAAVLRSLKKIGEVKSGGGSGSFSGDARVKFNSHWNRADLRVVAFVQEKHSLKILGAATTQMPPAGQN
jgi:hypothetical protein